MTPPCCRRPGKNKRIKFLILKSSLHSSWIKNQLFSGTVADSKQIITNFNFNNTTFSDCLLSPGNLLKNTDNINFKNYSLYNHIPTKNQKASGGSSILVKSNVPHRQIDINSNLQAVAVNVTLSKSITICSLYLPPHCKFSKHDLENLINQLPRP